MGQGVESWNHARRQNILLLRMAASAPPSHAVERVPAHVVPRCVVLQTPVAVKVLVDRENHANDVESLTLPPSVMRSLEEEVRRQG